MSRISRVLIILAGVMGADGVILAALSSHGGDVALLETASSMLLFHASAVLGTVALAERCLIHPKGGLAAALGFIVASLLFAGDLTMRHYTGHRLFPFAAPTGGTLLILSWLLLALTAAFSRRV
jgi:uncharacterized membrane protein YgdD (TMEM256/DUF423 family)